MDFGALLKTFIYLISSSLLYPVLFLLSVLVLWIIAYSGGFFAQWVQRMRLPSVPPEQLPEKILSEHGQMCMSPRVRDYVAKLYNLNHDLQHTDEAIENLLQDTVLRIQKSMDRLRIVIRVAPGLGLIGTLIPMGTGLAALGQGDMSRLTSDLVIAFTTTVVGLALGLLAFCMWTVKARWAEEDIRYVELATEVLTKAQQGKEELTKGPKKAGPWTMGTKMAVHQG